MALWMRKSVLQLVGLTVCGVFTLASSSSQGNTSDADTCKLNTKCREGTFLPTWGDPDVEPSTGERIARAFVYLVTMFFFFLGISIIADRFMAAIEIITSKEKEIRIKDKFTGKERIVSVKIWNETVSNLTLMALGSSAPEILLAVIEIIGRNFEAGDLGPSTIVGSAAFNLFIIIAVCVYVIPSSEVRRIKHLNVFAVTATTSVFAYIWMYLILAVISEGEVEIWEGLLTFLFFPILIILAYMADRKLNVYRMLRKKVRRQKRGGVMVVQTGDYDVIQVTAREVDSGGDGEVPKDVEGGEQAEGEEENLRVLAAHDMNEERRERAINVLRKLRQTNPDVTDKDMERILEQENLKVQPKSRAFYRIEATRKMTGSGSVLKAKHDKMDKLTSSVADVKLEMADLDEMEDKQIPTVYFDPPTYSVLENCGSVFLTVIRSGGEISKTTVYVDYKTQDGTAVAGEDFERTEGTIVFRQGETTKTIAIDIIDDDIFEEDEYFYVNLGNVRCAGPDGDLIKNSYDGQPGRVGKSSTANIIILDDDYPGCFSFEQDKQTVSETDGKVSLNVVRSVGARGCVRIPYHTVEGSAKGGGQDYEDVVGELEFQNEETSKIMEIEIVDHEDYEKNINFSVVLGEPITSKGHVDAQESESEMSSDPERDAEKERMEELGRPKLGEIPTVEVHITESKEFKNTVDKMLATTNLSALLGTSSWREQFVDALSVSGSGDDEEDESDEPAVPSYGDYMMHYLTLFWKVLFAFVPPTDIWGGWACFWVSILMIGLLTGLVGDLASHFGCTVGLSDGVVAITFVALGTSLPDTFASKVAAIADEYADSSIGNVTGSNAVNVFLGIGVAWSLAAIVHAARGTRFLVNPGSLGFSVMIFCVFALVAIALLMARRFTSKVMGELGGPTAYKIPTAVCLCLLWIMYVILSAMESYCHIKWAG